MQVTPRSRTTTRIQNIVFVVLFLTVIGLLAWLSTQYTVQADWTAGNRNTLSEASRKLLDRLDEPVAITAYARENEGLRRNIRDLVNRYRRADATLQFEFVNPDTVPNKVRELGITRDGTLVISYQGRTETVDELTEQALTNGLLRVARRGERKVVFVTGHGERSPRGQTAGDVSRFTRELEDSGLTVEMLNLGEGSSIPEATALLVIASPTAEWLDREVAAVKRYVADGGNLLWLTEPGGRHGLGPLAEQLGVAFTEGMVMEPAEQAMLTDQGLVMVERPTTQIVVSDYRAHATTRNLPNTAFREAAALTVEPPGDWETTRLLETVDKAWVETTNPGRNAQYDEGEDAQGPATIGVILTRSGKSGEAEGEHGADPDSPQDGAPTQGRSSASQRVAVIGDGDFISNAQLGTGGNLDLGVNLANWLTGEEQFVDIRPKSAPDSQLQLSRRATMLIGFGFLAGLPALLVAAGIGVWLRRRRR